MSRVLPILFNTEMVRAILDGRKDATRRIVKGFIPDDAVWGYTAFTPKGYISCRGTFADGYGEKFFKLPCEPGDILYVRETWKKAPNGYYYYEDWQRNDIADVTKWKPSIHMPKEAARIWLKVTDVRAERLQDIDEDGAVKEGIPWSECRNCKAPFGCDACAGEGYDEIDAFAELWDSTIKKIDLDFYGWNANPWVWVIEFERCEKPEEI
jgi:hypothetical protein